LWRFGSVLPVPFDAAISLGEGNTAVIGSAAYPGLSYKADFLTPTLSFKDRGAVVLATLAATLGVRAALTDSSGNAGTAVAAYFARAQIACRVFVPAATSPGKLAQMRAHGAQVVTVAGTRADAAAAARAAAEEPGILYASHVYHPYFLHGVKTYGYELWEQFGQRLPATVVVPIGNGTLALGAHLAFTELRAAGLIDRLPRLIGVQVAACAPVARAFAADATDIAGVPAQPTIAEGIAITEPPRGAAILAAIRSTGGTVLTVDDDAVRRARADLAAEGIYVEPTSAVCRAAVDQLPGVGVSLTDCVIPLCGAGLKAPG